MENDEYRAFRIYFSWPDGTEDSLIISGDSRAERQDEFTKAMESRGATCTGSERVE